MVRILGIVLVMALMAFSWTARAQDPVVLPSTYRHSLHSGLNGVEYQLTVVVPPGYEENPDARYPVLYFMDGNRWASLLAVLLPRFIKNAGYPPLIVVGVDYPGDTGRYQDYGPVSQRYFPVPEHRGYENFLRVLKKEIIPLVDTAYRTDPKDRGVGGHSMGGLFSAYALLNASETFNRFLISSPSLFYDNETLFEGFEAFSRKHVDRPLYVFTSAGEDELPTMLSALERFGQRAKEAQPNNVILRMMVVPEAGHATAVPAVMAPALQHMYNYRPRITPGTLDLYRFAGHYESPDGSVLMFVTDGRTLMYGDSTIDYDHGALVRLFASAPNRFWQRESATEYEFPLGDERADRVLVFNRKSAEPIEALRVPPRDIESTQRPVRLGKP